MSRLRLSLVVLAFWAAIFLPGLGALEIKGEEGRRILPGVTMLQTGNFIVPQVGSDPYFRKPPLINWLVAASFTITGQRAEWSARLPSVLCILAVALAFVVVARGSLGANGSFIAALLWMTNFGMIEKGRLIEIEALYVSLTGLAFICWMSWWQERRSPWLTWTVPWIFLGLGWLAKGPVHLVFFYAVVGALLIKQGQLRALLRPAHWVGISIMLGLFAAWAIPCLLMMPGNEVTQTWTHQFSGRLTGEDFKFAGWIKNIPRGLGYFLPWTLLFLFAGKAFRKGEDAQRPTSNVEHFVGNRMPTSELHRALAWGIATSFLLIVLLPGALARYTMPLLVPTVWLATSILSTDGFELPRWLRLRRPARLAQPVRLPFAVALVVSGALLIYGFALTPILGKREKVRNIGTAINAVLPPGEPLYAIDPDYQPALFYVRDPIVYLQRVAQLPPSGRFLLVQPADEAEALQRGRLLLRQRDYRGIEILVVETIR